MESTKYIDYNIHNAQQQSKLASSIFDKHAKKILLRYDPISFINSHKLLRTAIMASIIDAINSPINTSNKRPLGVKDSLGKMIYVSDLICYYHPVLCPAKEVKYFDGEAGVLEYNQHVVDIDGKRAIITMQEHVVRFNSNTGSYEPFLLNGHSFFSILKNHKSFIKRIKNMIESNNYYHFKGTNYNKSRR